MPVNDPAGSSRKQRPTFQPRSRARVRYYKASVVLAIVFLALVVVLPVWLDVLRRADDREALQRPLESRAVLSGTTPVATSAPEAPDRTPALESRPEFVNTACRGHVYARCNALRIGPRDCVEIAAEAIAVPQEGGHAACLAVVEPMLAARAAARDDTPPPPGRPTLVSGAAAPAVELAGSSPAEAAPPPVGEGTTPAGDGTADTPPEPRQPAGEEEDDREASPASGAAAAPTEPGGTTTLTPRERAERLSRMQTLIEEVQRASYNYATPPAVQAARMNELRTLADDLGTDEAKALYNRMLETYRTRPVAVPVEPVVGGYLGDSERVEVGVTRRSPTTTPELETVEAWADEARREAGLPAAAPAPEPGQALAPTATVGSEVPAASIDSVNPAATGTVESISP